MVQASERLGEGWGGIVHRLPVEQVDQSFWEDQDQFTERATKKVLSSLGIGHTLYEGLSAPLQRELLTTQRRSLQDEGADSFLLLERGGLIDFLAPEQEVGWEDPADLLDLQEDEGWQWLSEDLSAGKYRFVNQPQALKEAARGDYKPSLFFNLPIFYAAPVHLELGMFKIICTNGMVDVQTTLPIQLKLGDRMSADTFRLLLGGMQSALPQLEGQYTGMFNALRERPITPNDAIDLMIDFREDHKVPSYFLQQCMTHFDLLLDDMRVDENSPQAIETEYDVLDTMTYHAHNRISTMRTQNAAEREIYNFFSRRVGTGVVEPVRSFAEIAEDVVPEVEISVEQLN